MAERRPAELLAHVRELGQREAGAAVGLGDVGGEEARLLRELALLAEGGQEPREAAVGEAGLERDDLVLDERADHPADRGDARRFGEVHGGESTARRARHEGMLMRGRSRAAERKRPWYLVLALLGALAFGTTGAYEGWNAAATYYASVDVQSAGDGIADEHDRAVVIDRAEGELRAVDHAKSRGWPIAIAKLLLGGALLMLAVRALGGSGGARAALVQVVLAQAVVAIAAHFLLRDVFEAELGWVEAKAMAEGHAARGAQEVALPSSAVLRASMNVFLVLRTIGSLLIVVGLTRRRSREYFDGARATVQEP